MKKSRHIIAGLLAFLLLLLLGGCGPASTRGELPEGHIWVTDYLGREVAVPQNPQYVACLFSPATHIIAMLGDAGKMVAIPGGNTRDVLFVEIFPSVLQARTPKGSGTVNIEELFKDPVPQVIFLDAATIHDERMMKNLEAFGVPIVAVGFYSVEELKYNVALLGQIMGREERAAAYNAYLDEKLEMVASRIGNMPNSDKKIVYHAVNELLRTTVTNTVSGEIIPQAGIILSGSKATDDDESDRDNYKNFITLEQLFIWDPEYIIINGEDVYDYIYSERGSKLHSLSAYKNGKIYLLPMGISRWGHPHSTEGPLTLIWLAKLMHPELFADIDMGEEVKDFYRRFWGAELDDEMVEQMLSGRGLRSWPVFEMP
ncbi:MAG: ABC transporter substrate-binding protein [Clostridiales bacterium]|nr:ABC transporter substrate-binding protein [Clostridiales bacterium]